MDFISHLQLLTASTVDASANERQTLQSWTDRQIIQAKKVEDPKERVEDSFSSILDAYRDASFNHVSSHPVVEKILAKPDGRSLLDSLRSILSSNSRNDDISGELAELIGFDDIQLAMEILDNREIVLNKISLLDSRTEHDKPRAGREIRNTVNVDHAALWDPDESKRRIDTQIRANAARPLFTGIAHETPETLPNVYTSHSVVVGGSVLSQFGSKYMLPLGTTRKEYEDYEEVVIPPAKAVPPRETERLIPISELEPIAQGSFPGYTTLNRIQSIIYQTAFGSNENMLVCAPTGAGKTDVAMLAILRVLDQNRSTNSVHGTKSSMALSINRDTFKIIYVAPMKALASEIVRKFRKRLQWLDIRVRELTGDMQMTKDEIAETQIIVTTPEKWDVVTRKPTGEGELASKVRLLIIDEVHLLNEERGAVIETIVARTLRQVESSQSVIRIVGLSATLPNYQDVAEFLSVSRYTGLFFFDSSFRPIPLEQHFIGVKGKEGSQQHRKYLDSVTFQKVSELVREGHQVMVFVHSRKETVKTAQSLRESALAEGILEDFSCQDHPTWPLFRRSIGESRNKEMRQLFDDGFGIHHAGMLRSDRNMMETMFEARALKVLCCTATLAWGVNLPAHAVIIKGTRVYDSSKGSFTDLSVLDVLQVFGRAGRPGLETSGVGYICTPEEKLTHYLDAVTSQNPIESKFTQGLIDALNAEISLGTVANVREAIRWLGYTYLYVRLRKNPFQYGLTREEVVDDPHLGVKCHQLITEAAGRLAAARMINFDANSGEFAITDLGRIAAKYYIRYASIEVFNLKFLPKMSEADVLAMLSYSTEFNQVQLRESEVKELELLMGMVPCEVKGGTETQYGKVNILLQSFVSRLPVNDFALISDQAYVAQNGGRIIRALLEIALSRKWAGSSFVLMGLSKAVEKRMWPFDHPLRQSSLRPEVLHNLERWAEDYMVEDLAAMSGEELGKLIHLNEKHGIALLNAVKQFPSVYFDYALRPLGSDVLRIAVRVYRSFDWNSKIHGSAEPFWLWIEDSKGTSIKQLFHLLFRQTSETVDVDFVFSIPEGNPPTSMTVRYVSDRWIGAESELIISLESLIMPVTSHRHAPRLDLPFLLPNAIRDSRLEICLSGRIDAFNAIQTQIFWSLIHSKMHTLVCAPIGCGKSFMTMLLALKTTKVDTWTLIIVPRSSIASELIVELKVFSKALGLWSEVVSDVDVFKPIKGRCIRIVTTRSLLRALSREGSAMPMANLQLVICENLELLDAEYELSVSVLRQCIQAYPVRFVGVSNSLNDPADLAAWLQVDPSALHSFRPSDRDQSLSITTQTFSVPLSSALFKAMAKPAHSSIQSNSEELAIIFVPTRNLCHSVAIDLLTQCALEMETERGYISHTVSREDMELRLVHLQDRSLVDFLSRGVGFYHEGIRKSDRAIILQMFVEGILRVLIVPRIACWTVPVRAGVVIVMGTQYVQAEEGSSDRQVRDYELEEIVRMQGRAIRHNEGGHFYLFCQAEAKDTFARFLNDGLPLESKLHEAPQLLRGWFTGGTDSEGGHLNKDQVVQTLSFTFWARRVISNPVYYDVPIEEAQNKTFARLADTLEKTNTSTTI